MTNKYEQAKKELSSLASKQQMSAADPRQSVWVEASAGTGKTKVLSDRVLRLLLSKVDPGKILCLTYTKAAAVEMNERIAKRLSVWSVEEDSELAEDLSDLLGDNFLTEKKQEISLFARTLFARLLDTPGGMKIQTIHSFCQDILKRFPLEAGVSPYFEVLDDRTSKDILQNIKADLLQEADNSEDIDARNAVLYLTQNAGEYRFPEIMNMITENRSKLEALMLLYNNDIAQIIKALECKLGVNKQMSAEMIKQEALAQTNREKFKMALDALRQGSSEDLKKAEIFAKVGESDFSFSMYDLYKTAFFTDGKIRKKLATKSAIKIFPDIIDFMTDEAQRLQDADNKLASLSVLESTTAVLYIARSIINRYNFQKQIYAALDYEDLIVITKKLLENKSVADWVLFKLDGGIDHILIDEAQDTSPNQWAIIRALTQEFFAGIGAREDETNRTVFVVGDRKQSIYSFQGADPKEFDKMYHYFSKRAQNFSKVHLDVSFRSTKAVMDCVNMLFSTEKAQKGVIPDGEQINHRPYRLGDGGKVEILPLATAEKKAEKNDYNWRVPIYREQTNSVSNTVARQIAQHIKNMVESGEVLASKNRSVRYGDFMFLVQKRKNFVEEFVRACKELGVNVAGVDKLKLLEQIAAQDLISLGKFLLLPNDDLSLAEVLKSPLFGLDDDDLFVLCHQRKGSLFYHLINTPQYSDTAEQLKTLLNMTGFTRPFELFNYALVNLGGRKNFIRRMGAEVEDVLDEFLNLTIIFEQQHTPSLEAFIAWIMRDEVIIQKEMEQGESDTVKIMTVHGSKGLQAPIVILADTTTVKNKAQKSGLLWDNDELVYFPAASACYDENCKRVKKQNIEADFDEYRRLLYVALTRAEDRLYIAGFTSNKNANEDSWYTLLHDNLTSNVELTADDKRIVYEIAQENEFDDNKTSDTALVDTLPDLSFLFAPAESESPLAKPYTPSKNESDETELVASPLEEKGNFYRRGTAIHKLLQYIDILSDTDREEASFQFLAKQLPDFSTQDIHKIVLEVLELCRAYPDIFATNSMAEVPIIGEVDGKIISAKIDRLIIKEDKVIIVDYKTNRPAARTLAEVPDLYLKQLTAYKKLLEKLYPQKVVETYLLWTNTCNMMKV